MRLFFHFPQNKSAEAGLVYLWLHVTSINTDQPYHVEIGCYLRPSNKMRSR